MRTAATTHVSMQQPRQTQMQHIFLYTKKQRKKQRKIHTYLLVLLVVVDEKNLRQIRRCGSTSWIATGRCSALGIKQKSELAAREPLLPRVFLQECFARGDSSLRDQASPQLRKSKRIIANEKVPRGRYTATRRS